MPKEKKQDTTTPEKGPRDSSRRAYEVGRGKPPKATRFQKGKSGNPNGRPKKKEAEFDPGKILQAIDNEENVVLVDGKRKWLKNAEIHFRDLFFKALLGNFEAADLIKKYVEEFFGPEAEGPSDTRFIVMPDSYYSGPADDIDVPRKPYENSCFDPKVGSRRQRRQLKKDQLPVSVGSLFRKVAKERVPLEFNGDRVTMLEAYVRKVYAMANKNKRAARLLQQLRKAFPGEAPPGETITFLMRESDANL